MDNKQLGQLGEQLAVDYLTGRGYAIVERNWQFKPHEIDIIAMKDGRLIIVEVKTRSDGDMDAALDSVNAKKRRHMVTSANIYLKMMNLPHEIQFDIIVVLDCDRTPRLTHLPDAFHPPVSVKGGRGAHIVQR